MNDLTREQARVVRLLEKVNERYRRSLVTVEQLRDERYELYLHARSLDPPLTLHRIAEAVGVSQAAVSQELEARKRSEAEARKRDRARKRAEARRRARAEARQPAG